MTLVRRLSLAVALLLVSVASVDAAFFDGNKLKELVDARNRVDTNRTRDGDYLDAALFTGYVLGVADALEGILICTSEGIKARQLVGLVKKYVEDHPEDWNIKGDLLVHRALQP